MTADTLQLREAIAALQAGLDQEALLLERRLGQLRRLSEVVVAREDQPLERLLSEMEQTERLQEECDTQLQAARRELAASLRQPRPMRLSEIIPFLPETAAGELRARRGRILELIELVQRQHLRTAVLLSESIRINRLMLQSFLPACQHVETYGAGGRQHWQARAGLLDVES